MLKTLAIRLATWRRERETIRELSLLTSRELADLGISRADIACVAAGTDVDDVRAFVSAPLAANDSAISGPTWATHAPTSLVA